MMLMGRTVVISPNSVASQTGILGNAYCTFGECLLYEWVACLQASRWETARRRIGPVRQQLGTYGELVQWIANGSFLFVSCSWGSLSVLFCCWCGETARSANLTWT